MASERQGWTNGRPFIVTAEQCRAKWGGGDRDWKLRCYLCRTEASEGDTFRWVYMNSSTPSPGNFMVCRTCDFDGIAEAVRASLEDWKKTFGDYAGWSFQAFLKFHSISKELNAMNRQCLDQAIAIARGCQIEYGGGYWEQREIDAFHHGMQTVERCLRARQNQTDYQVALVEQMGLRELKREAEIAKGAEAK